MLYLSRIIFLYNDFQMPRRSEKVILSFLFLTIFIVFGARFRREWKEAYQSASIPSYRRVDWWVLSARCAQERHVLLVACGADGKLYPIEDVSPTDDRGHREVYGSVFRFFRSSLSIYTLLNCVISVG